MKKMIAVLLTMIVVAALPSSGISAAPSSTPIGGEGLEVCLSKNSSLAVLMLIDESKSLREFKDGGSVKPGNDPLDSRVPALESVVRVLASAVESSSLLAEMRGNHSKSQSVSRDLVMATTKESPSSA